MVLATKPKSRPGGAHHKQRTGRHHKHSHDYLRTYWPYIPMALLIAGGILLNNLWAHSHKGVLGYAVDMSTARLLADTNSQRTENGLKDLVPNEKLTKAATAKAQDMAAHNYWSHKSPSGTQPWNFIENTGYVYQLAGENLAYGFGTSDDTVAAWMGSAEHRDNMLNPSYTNVGFGIANASDFQNSGPQTIVVALYASPQPAQAAAVAAGLSPHAGVQSAQTVARIQLIGGPAGSWPALAAAVIASIAVVIFIVRHGLLLKKAFATSEVFIMKHRLLDILLLAVGVIGYLLTRTVGAIH